MEKHYKRCPNKIKMDTLRSQPFYEENIHFYGDDAFEDGEDEKEDEDEEALMAKIKSLFSNRKWKWTEISDEGTNGGFPEIRSLYLKHHGNRENLKHCKQIEAMLAAMDREIEDDDGLKAMQSTN